MNLSNVPMHHPTFTDPTNRPAGWVPSNWADAAWQHHAVMDLFGDLGSNTDARAVGRVLFRVEAELAAHDNTTGRVLVQSSVDPSAAGLRTTSLAPLLASYEAGQEVRLLLRANTVRTINRTHNGTTKRHRARVPDRHLPVWLADRLDGIVTIPTAQIVDRDGIELTVPDVKFTSGELRRGRAQLITTDFHANATVVDPQALARAVRDGIGRAKAYGCGMLTALPAT